MLRLILLIDCLLIDYIEASFEAEQERTEQSIVEVVSCRKEGKSEVIQKVSYFYTTLARRKVA